ncbi:MAG: hypothetical protein GY696_22395 [Gammaproteobacteria bacterium]|nr:hypothetical protein [Gammaproteobacteria bacterium]
MQSEPANEVRDVQATVRQSATTERNTVSTMLDRQAVVDGGWKRRFFTLDGSPICLYCKRAGHVRRDCRKRLRDFGPPPDSTDRRPPTPRHEIFATLGCRKIRPTRGCRGAGKKRRPDFFQGGSVSVGENPCAFGPIQRPVKVPVLEHTPNLDFLCAQMSNLDDPALFLGSRTAVMAGPAEEQPREVALIQDGGMIEHEWLETVVVPLENQETMIQGMVVPNLFLENGTNDDNLVSSDDEQRSIPKVGNNNAEYVVSDSAGVKPPEGRPVRRPYFMIGNVVTTFLTALLCFSMMSAGFPLTEGQIFGANSVPRVRPVSRGPVFQEVLCFCPSLLGGSKVRQSNGRRSHLWCDWSHTFCNERQSNGRRSHLWCDMNRCFCNVWQKGRKPHLWRDWDHTVWCRKLPWCPDERRGNRSFPGGGTIGSQDCFHFGKLHTATTFAGQWNDQRRYDGITKFLEWSTETMDGYQPISRSPYPIGDRRPEIGDRRPAEFGDGTGWMDPWSTTNFIHSMDTQCNQSIIPGHVLQGKKTRRKEGSQGRLGFYELVCFCYFT